MGLLQPLPSHAILTQEWQDQLTGWEQYPSLQTAHIPPDHKEDILHPTSLGQPHPHGRPARGFPKLPFPRARKSMTPWKLPIPHSPASLALPSAWWLQI